MAEPPLHASCVAINGQAVLILGPSGAGKSDLALRLIDRGAILVSDDATLLASDADGVPRASAPATIAGQLEVRHIGIITLPWLDNVPVALAIQLVDRPERMPEPDAFLQLAGARLRCVRIDAREVSAPIKVELALARLNTANLSA
jgi:serine kinase of HPr protein (carbohydrate metabolism regulator)